jgi:hypothetical protein
LLQRGSRHLLRRASLGSLAFPAVTGAILGLYALLRAPVLNAPASLDSWYYTALFRNFDYLFSTFRSAYYPSRLPWIIPGIAANRVLPPVGAFFLLHITFFVGGGLFAFLLARRFYGSRVALVAAATVMLSPLFFEAHSTDYPDGGAITYLLGAAYFAISAFESRRRPLRLAAAGFFAAAAFGTQIYAAIPILGLVLVYLTVFHVEQDFLRRFARDVAAAAAGAFALLVVCGTVARTHGGEFLFFMPSWRYAQSIKLSNWKHPGYDWMLGEPQLLLPLFFLALLAVLLLRTRLRGWRSDPSLRLATGSGVLLAYMVLFIGIWEFWGGGDFLEVSYYFSIFLVPLALAIPATLYLLAREARISWPARAVVAALVVAAAPLVILHRSGIAPAGRASFYLVAGLMSAALVAAAAAGRVPRTLRVAVATLGVVLALGATSYAGTSGSSTGSSFGLSGTFTERRAVLSDALQLIDFMRVSGLQNEWPPANFWYDGYKYPALNGIQSTYFWGITWIGRKMPQVDPSIRARLENRKPPSVVLLCGAPDCAGGPAALERAGYRLRPRAQTVIASHGERYWVKAFRIPKFKVVDPRTLWWAYSQSPFVAAPRGRVIRRWSLQRGLPPHWSGGDRLRPAGSYASVTTGADTWRYEVVSDKLTLPPGSYRLYLRGKVLAGGLDMGVLGVAANSWVSQRTYWYGQSGFDRHWMATPFQLDTPTQLQFVLSNWVPHNMSSEWQLRELRLVRVG